MKKMFSPKENTGSYLAKRVSKQFNILLSFNLTLVR